MEKYRGLWLKCVGQCYTTSAGDMEAQCGGGTGKLECVQPVCCLLSDVFDGMQE